MSLKTVKPATTFAASAAFTLRARAPITNASSTSQSTACDSGGRTIGSRAPINETAYFAKSVGWLGSSRPISSMCAL